MTMVLKSEIIFVVLFFFILPQIFADNLPSDDRSLVGFWKLDDGFGNIIKDSSGNEHDGLVSGYLRWIYDQNKRKYLLFDARSTVVRVKNLDLPDPITEATLESWIYLTEKPEEQLRMWNSFFITPAGSLGVGKEKSNIYFETFDLITGKKTGAASSTEIEKEKWYHIAVVLNKEKITIYINGKTAGSSPGCSGFKRMGNNVTFISPVSFFKGIIADAHFYKLAIGEDEIQKHFENDRIKFTDGFFIERTKREIRKENFEGDMTSTEWILSPLATVTANSDEVIQGKKSLKLKGEGLGRLYKLIIISQTTLTGKATYKFSFDYKISGRDRHLNEDACFRISLIPGFYETPGNYYLGYESIDNILDLSWGVSSGFQGKGNRGPETIRGKCGITGHKELCFSPAEAARLKIAFELFGESEIIIDNLDIEIVKSSDTPPLIPVLYAPLQDSTLSKTSLDFSWDGGGNAVRYEIQIASNDDFSTDLHSCLVDDINSEQMYWLPDDLKLSAGQWYWRVRGVNEYGSLGEWSEIRNFCLRKNIDMMPLKRKVEAVKPLFIFRLSLTNSEMFLKNCEQTFPTSVKSFSALEIYGKELFTLSNVKHAEKIINSIDMPVCIMVSIAAKVHDCSLNIIPLSIIEDLFLNCKNLEGITVAEQFVWEPYVKNYHNRLYPLLAQYGKYMIDSSMGHHFWLMFDSQWRKNASEYSEYVFPVLKYVHPSLEGYSVLFGWSLTHLNSHWGTGAESWFWNNAGFQDLNSPPIRFTAPEKWKTLMRQNKFTIGLFPPTFWSVIMLTGLAGGGDIFSFESAIPGIHGATSSSGLWYVDGTPTSVWNNVVLPLMEDIVKYRLVPSKEDVLSKVKTACLIKEDEIYRGNVIGWAYACWPSKLDPIMYGIYGVKRIIWDMIPNESRYYFVPFITEDEKSRLPSSIKTIIDTEMFKTPKSVRTYLNQFYPQREPGTAIVYSVGKVHVVLNSNENDDIMENYVIAFDDPFIKKIKGGIGVHQYIIGKFLDERILFIHVNNRAERNSILEFECSGRPNFKIIPDSAVVDTIWNGKNKTMTVTVNHKQGAVRLFLRGD